MQTKKDLVNLEKFRLDQKECVSVNLLFETVQLKLRKCTTASQDIHLHRLAMKVLDIRIIHIPIVLVQCHGQVHSSVLDGNDHDHYINLCFIAIVTY